MIKPGHKTVETANGRDVEQTVKSVSIAEDISFPHAAQVAQIIRKSGRWEPGGDTPRRFTLSRR